MRIVHLDSGREMRGGQWQVLHLIEWLQEQGYEQVLIAPRQSPLAKRVPIPVRALTWLTCFRQQGDIFHAHDARTHTMAALTRRSPLIVSRRVAFPVKTRWKYRLADRYIAVSRFVRTELLRAGVPAEKIEVVYDGVPALPMSSEDGGIIAPESGDPQKGSDLIRASGVACDFVTDLPRALRRAQVMLYITRQEGLGSAALLAMSAGVPVIASRIGGLPEIVEEGRTGLLVDNTPESIRAAVARVGEMREMGRRGRELVHSRFLFADMAAATLRVYRETLG